MSKNSKHLLIIGITGSASLFQALYLLHSLKSKGFEIKVIMSEVASNFVTPLFISEVLEDKVYIKEKDVDIDLIDWADLFVVIPITANTISKIKQKTFDTLLLKTVSSFIENKIDKLAIAPAMRKEMWEDKDNLEAIEILKNKGITLLMPEVKRGHANLINNDDAELFILKHFEESILKGKRVLITAGATQEKLDAFRFITNRSTGKMGYSLAEEAYRLGAEVTLISAPTNLKPVGFINSKSVTSAKDMLEAVLGCIDKTDIFISAAAVSDFCFKDIFSQKLKKEEILNKQLELVLNPDILKESKLKNPNLLAVGFCAETSNLLPNARKKLVEKNSDIIIANEISDTKGFASDYNSVTIVTKNEEVIIPEKPKQIIAKDILLFISKFNSVKA